MLLEGIENKRDFLNMINPKIRILGFLITLLAITISNDVRILFCFFSCGIFLLYLNKFNLKLLIKRLYIFNIFIFFIMIILIFTTPGETIAMFSGLSISDTGIHYAGKVLLKSNSMVFFLISLLSSVPISKIVSVFNYLKIPQKLTYLFFFTYRYIFVVQKEYSDIVNSIKLRGFIPKTNFHTYSTYGNLIGMIFLKSYNNSEAVYNAMLCRGFNNKFHNHYNFKDTKFDIIFLILIVVFNFGMLLWERI